MISDEEYKVIIACNLVILHC